MFLQLLTWKLPIKKLVEFIFVPFFVCKFTVFSPHFDSFCEHTWNCGVTRRLIIPSVILMWSANSGQDVIINKSFLWNWWSVYVCVCVFLIFLCAPDLLNAVHTSEYFEQMKSLYMHLNIAISNTGQQFFRNPGFLIFCL